MTSILDISKQNFRLLSKYILLLAFIGLINACDNLDNGVILPEAVDDVLTLSVTNSELVLTEDSASEEFEFSWTTGSNYGTGASIDYILQFDKKGNDFSNAISTDLGTAVYSETYTYSSLNDLLLSDLDFTYNEVDTLESRVIAVIASDEVEPDTSDVVDICITPYEEETSIDELYIIGSATEVGWDIENAIALTQDTANESQFIFDGILTEGTFKFPVNTDTDWNQDMYMCDTDDDTKIYLHNGGDSDDNQWTITQEGWYRIVVNVSELTISIDCLDHLYIIGDATSAGWDMSSAIELEQDDNYYEFTYSGELTAGEFKFPVNQDTDWGQDMFMADPDDDTKMYRHIGGASDDNKWTIEEDGTYDLTLNVKDLTINISKQ